MKLPIIAASLLLSACVANRTTIESSWTDAEYAGPPLDRVAIVALFHTRADSLAFERNAAEYLAADGVAAVPAHELLTPATSHELDERTVLEQLAGADVDGVLLFRLVAVDERREYQVPTPYLLNGSPDDASGAFAPTPPPSSSYYWFSSGTSSAPAAEAAPGYWIEQTFLVAETALFDNRNDRLLWTAKSETMDDARFARTSESIVRTVARRLFAMDLIARMAAPSGSRREAEPG
jgi:hypothetical protein